VFGDGESMGAGGELGRTDAIGDEALVSRDPGVKFAQGLLEMGVKAVIEYITIFAENEFAEEIQCSDGSLGLMIACLGASFGGVSVMVFISC
jgi:hypothetical protein